MKKTTVIHITRKQSVIDRLLNPNTYKSLLDIVLAIAAWGLKMCGKALLWTSNVYFYTFGIIASVLYISDDLGWHSVVIWPPIGFWLSWVFLGFFVKVFRHFMDTDKYTFLGGMTITVVVFIANNVVMLLSPILYHHFFVAS